MIVTSNSLAFFTETRKVTEQLCKPLETEDYVVQPAVDVSPPKWHLGHTTWFFEEFVLQKFSKNYIRFDSDFAFVFNSYYETIGKRVVRANRGNLSRPSVSKVYEYRAYVDKAMANLLSEEVSDALFEILEVGIHHEKQHQELLLTDIKYILGNNPLLPVYNPHFLEHIEITQERKWISFEADLYDIGYQGSAFCYDNELGTHKVYLQDFQISNTLVSNEEYMEFIEDKGYQRFQFWHAEGWDWINTNHIKAPLYWHQIEGTPYHYTFNGLQKINMRTPITHISYYEAYAFAQWKGLRLPTEFEWEVAQNNFDWGKRWEWTESAYLPYPGYKKADGALGEYNGKFMVNQKVLRGGSVATSKNHTRPTYRNFFHPNLQWQFTGLRLAK
ncbi:ergothioneine biosynthesis protein EgtB [Ascidiimonas sp. W6]|uniref:ergothioneine biosynthesis protein EgtB n=1 Tax=Ascidiimonas meishanensis TaxID=3128903 RepID=UPI0030EBC4DD